MHIYGIQNNDLVNNKQPQFKGFERTVVKPLGNLVENVVHRNNTYIFRNDLNWDKLIELIKIKYAKAEKVNVYNYACSNGLEAYSFLMKLMANTPKEFVNKCTPIIARDYDNFAIMMAKTKMVDIWPDEIERIERHTFGGQNYFFRKLNGRKIDEYKYMVNPVLTEKVDFDYGDITTDYTKFNKDNTILFARNFWPYLGRADQLELPELIYKAMGKNSMIILGSYDCPTYSKNNEFYDFFVNAGFKKTDVPYVYVK